MLGRRSGPAADRDLWIPSSLRQAGEQGQPPPLPPRPSPGWSGPPVGFTPSPTSSEPAHLEQRALGCVGGFFQQTGMRGSGKLLSWFDPRVHDVRNDLPRPDGMTDADLLTAVAFSLSFLLSLAFFFFPSPLSFSPFLSLSFSPPLSSSLRPNYCRSETHVL